MAKRFAKAAITRELTQSDIKPVKGKIDGRMSTVTLGQLDARRRRFVRVKRRGAKGEVDFLVDHRKHTVSCVVDGNVIELARIRRKKGRGLSTPTRVVSRGKPVRRPSPQPPKNWGLFGQNLSYILSLTLFAYVVSTGVIGALDGVQGFADAVGNNIDKVVIGFMREFNEFGGHAKDALATTMYNANVFAKNGQDFYIEKEKLGAVAKFGQWLFALWLTMNQGALPILG